MNSFYLNAVNDPYDLWSSPLGVKIRDSYYRNKISGKLAAVFLGVVDWILPEISRSILGTVKRTYPIVIGHEILRMNYCGELNATQAVHAIEVGNSVLSKRLGESECSWGLGFPWMSKNGLYGPDIPFVTHTPYMMEALLVLEKVPVVHDKAMEMFHGTWGFLETLKVMYEDGESLALSYAPIDEPRMVVNANAYAAFAYALHAVHGKEGNCEVAKAKVERIVRWVIAQQGKNGSWFYYADNDPGNFIDCFHSCFVVKNLLKVSRLLPGFSGLIKPVTDKGWAYIKNELYDNDSGLCRRFTVRAQRDPFKLDLYDQAEYLGLLVDYGLFDEASEFAEWVEKKFRKGEHWYCRIDIFGRRWGKDFLRWGIVPFWYHQARLKAENDDH